MPDFSCTRIAPTPNGYLHLGHVYHLYHIKAFVEIFGTKVILRIEDHDQNRYRKVYEDQIYKDLETLGIGFDCVYHQSKRFDVYSQFHNTRSDLFYSCTCTRKELQDRGVNSYDRHCYKFSPKNDAPASLRIKTDDSYRFKFNDLNLGEQIQSINHTDCIIRDKDGFYTYQYCVSLDDLDQGVDLIIRGSDLLSSTATQCYIQSLYRPNESRKISYFHHDLILDTTEQKLSKTRLSMPFHEHLQCTDIASIEAHILKSLGGSFSDLIRNIESAVALHC
jgi:glutamyl/glutaminyl-tRNA synthetase